MAGKTIGHLKKDKRKKKQQQKDFLMWLEEYASVSRAAKKAKVARSNVYLWLKEKNADGKPGSFKVAFDEACDIAVGALEDEAVRRAYEGVIKPVFQGGKEVGKLREYSDTLMIVLLKASAPEKYKDRVQQEQTGKGGGPVQTETKHTVVFKKMSRSKDDQ